MLALWVAISQLSFPKRITDGLDLMTMAVSPTSITGLKEAGTPQADLFIAVTPSETKNMTCCILAHSLGAKKTVARIDNAEYVEERNLEFFQRMGIGSLIYPELLAVRGSDNGGKSTAEHSLFWESSCARRLRHSTANS